MSSIEQWRTSGSKDTWVERFEIWQRIETHDQSTVYVQLVCYAYLNLLLLK